MREYLEGIIATLRAERDELRNAMIDEQGVLAKRTTQRNELRERCEALEARLDATIKVVDHLADTMEIPPGAVDSLQVALGVYED